MKIIFVIIAAMFLSSAIYAQVHVNVNLGGPVYWGHSGYYSPRVIVYHRLPVRHVIYRDRNYYDNDSRYYGNENRSGYESYPMQKHDNGKHKGWYKNNGNSYDNRNGNGDSRRNDNSYNNDNGNRYYNDNNNENNNENNNVVPDKYK